MSILVPKGDINLLPDGTCDEFRHSLRYLTINQMKLIGLE